MARGETEPPGPLLPHWHTVPAPLLPIAPSVLLDCKGCEGETTALMVTRGPQGIALGRCSVNKGLEIS